MLRELKVEHRKIGNIEGFNKGYNKAMDDFVKWLVEHKIVDEDSMPEIIMDFNEEQLKAGASNGNL